MLIESTIFNHSLISEAGIFKIILKSIYMSDSENSIQNLFVTFEVRATRNQTPGLWFICCEFLKKLFSNSVTLVFSAE